MITVVCIFAPLAIVTAIIEGALNIPEKLQEHREFAMYRQTRRTKWD